MRLCLPNGFIMLKSYKFNASLFFNGTHCSYSDLAAHFALDKSDRKLWVVIMADIYVTAFQ